MGNKFKIMNTIKACFDEILRGNEQDSRLAAREVRKILYSSRGEKDKYQDIHNFTSSIARPCILLPS